MDVKTIQDFLPKQSLKMNLIVDYRKAIHPQCGKEVTDYKDIIITPFYTAEFCDELVEMSEFYSKKFSPNSMRLARPRDYTGDDTNIIPWDTLFFSRISHILFEDFCDHYKKYLCPILEQHFDPETITGWFSPMIIKYSREGQNVTLHTDASLFTLNVKLNTEFEGCELEFPRQGWSNRDIPKGWCFIWPSKVTHPHKANPLISGTKYTLGSWTHPMSWGPDDTGGSIYYYENELEN